VSLHKRRRQPELMDAPSLDPALHRQALNGLRTLNWVTRSVTIVWPSILRVAQAIPDRVVRVLDVACGGGDVACGVMQRARAAGVNVQVDGCDMSTTAIAASLELASQIGFSDAKFFFADVLNDRLPAGYDVVMCSLFLHHFDDPQTLHILQSMRAATENLLLISDLERSTWGYLLAWVGCHLFSRSSIVHVDGPRSVEGAYTRQEFVALAERAGLAGGQLSRHWPERFLLEWRKHAG
jgi:2-polyprenyl-3-methyl-5-hydroxy-6-metoxy-1,4-benzoquinol methylase